MQRAPIGALCIAPVPDVTGLLLRRHAGLKSDRR